MKELKDLFKNKKFVIGICLGLVIVSLLIILLLFLTNNNSDNDNINTITTKPTTSITTTTNVAENDNELENENINNNHSNTTNSIAKKTTTKKAQSNTNNKTTQKTSMTEKTSTTQSTTKPITTLKKYIVSFNSDGGTSVNNKVVYENQTLDVLPSTKKKDYEFNGWYLNNIKFIISTKVNSNLTLLAKYTYLDAKSQLEEGYPRPDIAYSYSTVESGQRYLDLLNALWDDEMVPRLNNGFYSQEEIDDYLEWIDNKAYEFREVLECLPGHEYMCE